MVELQFFFAIIIAVGLITIGGVLTDVVSIPNDETGDDE